MSSWHDAPNLPFLKNIVDNGRSPAEVIIKSVAIHVACVYAVAHLGTLRQLPVKDHIYEVAVFILLPTLPLAQVLIGMAEILKCLILKRRHNSFGWKYQLSAALRVYAVDSSTNGNMAMPLAAIEPSSGLAPAEAAECSEKDEKDYKWYLRVGPIVLLIAETTWSIVLWIRRIAFWQLDLAQQQTCPPSKSCVADSDLDHMNGAAMFGGLSAGIAILACHCLNSNWACSSRTFQRAIATGRQRTREFRLREAAVAWLLELAIVYRVLQSVVIPSTISVFQEVMFGDLLLTLKILFTWNQVCLIAFFAFAIFMGITSLITDMVARRILKSKHKWLTWLTWDLTFAMVISLRIYSIFAAVVSVQEMYACSIYSCSSPYVFWADPWSNKFLTL